MYAIFMIKRLSTTFALNCIKFEQVNQVDTFGFSGGWGIAIIGGNGELSCMGLKIGVCRSKMSDTSNRGVDNCVATGFKPFCVWLSMSIRRIYWKRE